MFGLSCIVGLPMAIGGFDSRPFPSGRFQWLLLCTSVMLGAALLLWSDSRTTLRASMLSFRGNLVALLFAAWAVWLIATSILAVDPIPALLGDALRREGALSWLGLAMVAVGIYVTAVNDARRRIWILALSLGSVVPAGVTLMQFLLSDLTLKLTLVGTLGNPVYLGALMMLALPLTVAQWFGAAKKGERLVWLVLGGVQCAALFLSMARGPLIGAGIALWSLLIWVGLVQRRREVVWAAMAIPALAAIVLLVLNLFPAIGEQVPALGRFQFKASGSTDARLGIWSAGLALFTESGLFRQLVGHGIDTGILVFMSYMPATVFRIEGLGLNVDRMHSQILETLLTTGSVGLVIELALFGAVMHRWLIAADLRIGLGRAYGVALVTGLLGALAGLLLLPQSVWPSAFGIGYGLGWLGLWLHGAWRRVATTPEGASGTTNQVLNAALGVALAAYWVESQLGVNDVTVRLWAFATAALITAQPVPGLRAVREGPSAATPTEKATFGFSLHPVAWSVMPFVFLVVAPARQGDSAWLAPALDSMVWALGMGGLLLVFAGGCSRFLGFTGRTELASASDWVSKAGWNLAGLLLLGAFYFVGMSTLAGLTVETAGLATDLTLATWCVTGTAFFATLGFALVVFGGAPHPPLARFASYPGRASFAAVCAIGLLMGACFFSFMESRSGIATRLYLWANGQGKVESAASYVRDAALHSPTQRTAWIVLSQFEFGLALSAARSAVPSDPARAALVRDPLARSIAAAQRGLSVAAGDPFLLALLAETSSLKAAPFAADVFGGEAARKGHGQEAIRYFEQSLKTRGNHPYSLRSLVRLELDYGTRERALQFAERLIASDPKSEIGYEEKALIALKANDMAQFAAVLREGIAKTGGAPSLRRPLAEWLFRQGDVAGAARELEAVVAKTPKDWTAVRDLIRLYLRQNANDKALALAQGARSFVPEQERASLEELLRNLEPKPFTGGGLKP